MFNAVNIAANEGAIRAVVAARSANVLPLPLPTLPLTGAGMVVVFADFKSKV